MKFFLILPNKYYIFVTSTFLSASPSPAPFCSIFGGPNRLDLWLDLCLKLLFDCQNLWIVTNGVAGDMYLEFVVIFVRFWEADHPLITKKHARNPPICGHTLHHTKAVKRNASQCKCNACKGCLLHKPNLNVSSPKKIAAQSTSIIQIYAESSPSRSLGSIVKLYMCYAIHARKKERSVS